MGGIFHIFDFSQDIMSRKMLTNKRCADGLEAPRNSLDLPIEASQNYYAVGDYVPYSSKLQYNSKSKSHPSDNSMKKLIDKEMSKGPDGRRNVPSVVARLMGMDTLPPDMSSAVYASEKKNESTENNFSGKLQTKKGSTGRSSRGSKPCKQIELDLLPHNKERDVGLVDSGLNFGKPRPREHPQEEELQKFKKDFEAWQAAKVWERSGVIELGGVPRQWLAQENLHKEKMALYADSRRITTTEKPLEARTHNLPPAINEWSQERGALQHCGYRKEKFQINQKESLPLRNRTLISDFEQSLLMNGDHKQGKSSVPTRIVILKPGPHKSGVNEEPWTSSSDIVEEEGSIEDFLEEVKEKLRSEIHGKTVNSGTVVRGSGIETPFSEKPSNPRLIARHIAKQVRESVTRDLGMHLLRSASTRSYKSEVQINDPGSPEFINRDTRKFLSERLRNVLKREGHPDIPMFVSESSQASILDGEGVRLGPTGDVSMTSNRENYWENLKDEPEILARSFRHGPNNNEMLNKGDVSPRNLIRSLSAPVSGTSFGKLLLEDRHVLTGAHIRRKHESTENFPVEVKKTRKERFNFRGKVSSFKYSIIRGKLFGKRIQSMEEPGKSESDARKDITSGPTDVMNFGTTHENFTEVPPSPASVCSSAHEELCRAADHLSPISTLDVPLIEDQTVPQAFRQISSDLEELRRQLNLLDCDVSKYQSTDEEPPEAEMVDPEGQAEAYLRDLLVASGLYGGSSDWTFSRWDPLSKPIGDRVFEEVEESYRRQPKENEVITDEVEDKVDRKMLFDLLNEALSTILGSTVTMSGFRRKIIGPNSPPPPRGKKLLDRVRQMICLYVYPPKDGSFYSFDNMTSRDLRATPWLGMMHDDVDVIGREMESVILEDLIEETMRDPWL